jgi:hypothetical protein
MKMTVFWVVAPCSLVDVYWHFKGVCCLHQQGLHHPDDGGSKNLWNVGNLLPDYTAQQPKRQSLHICYVFSYTPSIFHVRSIQILQNFLSVSDICSFITQCIACFKSLMRGQRAMLWVLCHCVQNLFLFWMRRQVKVAICIDLNILFQGRTAHQTALFRVSVSCLTIISTFLIIWLLSKHRTFKMLNTLFWKSS